MKKAIININYDSKLSVQELFDKLSEHTNMKYTIGVKTTRIKDGSPEINGVGSVRKFALLGLEETVMVYEPHKLIEYKATKGGLIKNHYGKMIFTPTPNGSQLHWNIEFTSFPIVQNIMQFVIERTANKGLKKFV